MPEGPSIYILKEELKQFIGQKIINVRGNSKVGIEVIKGLMIHDVKSWGKHLLICLESELTVKIHFMLFGSYNINERKDRQERLGLEFLIGEVNFYSCSVKFLTGNLDSIYDWSSDVMSVTWDPEKAKEKLKRFPEELVCDLLLNQEIFSGVGNIIKNEVLFRVMIHPESITGKLNNLNINKLITDAREYSFQFLDWKRSYVLKKNYQVHTKMICPRCSVNLTKKHLGKTKRRSFYCEKCQILYT